MTRYVYFARRADGDGPIKIGCSCSPERRVREMSYGGRPKLSLIVKVPGLYADENTLHRMFAGSREHGEWFSATPELLELIEQIQSTGEPPQVFFRRKIAA